MFLAHPSSKMVFVDLAPTWTLLPAGGPLLGDWKNMHYTAWLEKQKILHDHNGKP
jgi:hypothetical protein